jgi:diguanylate cyclase
MIRLIPRRRPGFPRGTAARATRAYLAAGGLLVLAGPALGSAARQFSYVLAGVSVLVAIRYGVRRYQPASVLTWWLLGASVIIGLLASLCWAVDLARYGQPQFPSGGDLLYTLMLPLLILSAVGWVRGGSGRAVSVELGIVAAGGAALIWTLAVDPLLTGDRITGLRLASYLAYLGFDLLLLTQAVRVAMLTRVRTPAYGLMVTAAFVLVGTDTLFYALAARGLAAEQLTTSGYLATYLLLGAAALHPSMAASAGQVPAEPTPMSRSRLVGYLALIVMSGLLTGYAADGGWPRIAVPLALSGAMSVLLVVRLAQLAVLLNERARVDSLTGLGNLTRLRERLGRRTSAGSLLLIDLDGFRDVNDCYGHQTGDAILCEVAARLRRLAAPHSATALRVGADEFAILLGPAADAAFAAEAVLRAVREPYTVPAGGSVLLTASVGLLPLRSSTGAEDRLRQADLALLAAQHAGGDQVEIYDVDLHADRQARTRLVSSLHRAVANQEFTVHYQPIVELSTGRIVAAEALLRWAPDGVPVSPAEFVPVAEQSGTIVPIGGWVIEEVCRSLRDWFPAYGISVAINVSARQLRRPDFAETVLASLRAYDLPGEALIVEITETALITAVADLPTVTAHLHVLREHGVRIAIDDFGTGYSSLAYLRQLPVDILKMDGSFTTHQVHNDGPRDRAFIRAIVELAASLGLRTVAEAVETEQQAERLRALHCDLAQGFHFARPVPAAEFGQVLDARAFTLVTGTGRS